VDVPAEARAHEGMGGAAWEPTFLAVARVDATDESAEVGLRAVAAFRRVVTTLQLFKAGGVALGPYAWIRSAGDRWRRIATGAGKPRPGGYRLADTELAELAGFSRALAANGSPFSRIDGDHNGFHAVLGRAISRFQAGLDRPITLEALNDYLLTLRFMLEGGGPASLGMPMRVAALCAEPDDRTAVKETVDRAIAMERELWSGEPATGPERRPPAEIAAEIEDLTRAILGDAACGHLGTELRTTADEILLGEGLQVGEGAPDSRGETAEWNPSVAIEDEDFGVETLSEELEAAVGPPAAEPAAEDEDETENTPPPPEHGFTRAQNLIHEMEPAAEPAANPVGPGREAEEPAAYPVGPGREAEEPADMDFDWEEPMPSAEREPRPGADPAGPGREAEEPTGFDSGDFEGAEIRVLRPRPAESPVDELIADSDQHRRDVANRVSFLFPRPETTEWQVREVGYDRTRRAEVDEPSTHS
jgi:hypothetical protein